jgi:hypothetical protein
MLEKFLTMPQKDFSELLKASPLGTDRRHEREAYRYAKVWAHFDLLQCCMLTTAVRELCV